MQFKVLGLPDLKCAIQSFAELKRLDFDREKFVRVRFRRLNSSCLPACYYRAILAQ
jgi:hypothetical protein